MRAVPEHVWAIQHNILFLDESQVGENRVYPLLRTAIGALAVV
jgi:hypothetical protein